MALGTGLEHSSRSKCGRTNVQEKTIHRAFLAIYPADQPVDRPCTPAAHQAAREASVTSADEDSEAHTDGVARDLSPLE